MIAPHVQQRHLAQHSLEEIWALHHHGSYQQATIAAPFDAQMRWHRDAPRDEVFSNGNEVVVAFLFVGAYRRLVPGGAKFTTAANIGQHKNATARQPLAADHAGIKRRL